MTGVIIKEDYCKVNNKRMIMSKIMFVFIYKHWINKKKII